MISSYPRGGGMGRVRGTEIPGAAEGRQGPLRGRREAAEAEGRQEAAGRPPRDREGVVNS